jgi:hypothetical protein
MAKQQSLGSKDGDAWIIDVNMGYGHSRAAHALKDLGGGEVISANDYPGIPPKDRRYWTQSRKLYEFLSRMKPIPLIGDAVFEILDRFQEIPPFYPHRNLSDPNLQLRQIYYFIKRGLGRDLIDRLSDDPKPIVTTFFVAAFFADYWDYPGDIYCVTTDTDISRTWVGLDPKSSRINYLASSGRVVERLQLYGVPEDRIFLTGFPLPKSLIGGPESEDLKDLLMDRICNLDPRGIFVDRYKRTLKDELGAQRCKQEEAGHPLTITYSVGGAGAQRRLGVKILKSLRHRIARREVRLNLMAGVRSDVAEFFKRAAVNNNLEDELGEWVRVPTYDSRDDYFTDFNEVMKTTDILWTKPSELSFYTGLGIPLVTAPPIGSQEEFNEFWLRYVSGGTPQFKPAHTNEWLIDWIESGGMARMAWSGYIEAPTHGTYRIEDLVLGREQRMPPHPMIV